MHWSKWWLANWVFHSVLEQLTARSSHHKSAQPTTTTATGKVDIPQGLVDHNGLFMDIYVGWPGRVHDARVSSLFKKGQEGSLLPNSTETIGQHEIPLVILGDPAYPLLKWLMKAYPDTGSLTPQQKTFNYRRCWACLWSSKGSMEMFNEAQRYQHWWYTYSCFSLLCFAQYLWSSWRISWSIIWWRSGLRLTHPLARLDSRLSRY